MNSAPGYSKRNTTRTVLAITLVASASLLVACGGDKKKGATQVAAKVNKDEISVHQINFVLQRTPGLRPEQAQDASKRILEGLIDQELAVQQAGEQKLDRDPNVVMTIEAARREILARAYADKLASSVSKPTDSDVAEYYKTHPGLFAQRRIYALQEIAIEANAEQQATLKPKLSSVTNADQVVNLLKSEGLRYGSRAVTQAPENLPLPLVDKLASMSDGQFIVNPTANGFTMVFIGSSKPAPVTQDKAKTAIENFLVNDRKRTLIAENMKSLRQSAKVEYMGQFSQGAAPAEAASTAAAPAVLPATSASGIDESSLNRGLSGLK